MSKKITLLCFVFCFKLTLKAQERCGTPTYFSGFANATAMAVEEARIQSQILLNRNALQTRTVIRIPVVVHIIYLRDEENISDENVYSQIAALNRDYRHKNADSTKTPDDWKNIAADIGFEFCLATKDPAGNPTTGITRTKTNRLFIGGGFDGFKHYSTGGIDGWNPQKYLNIWVGNIGTDLFGYAYYPTQLLSTPANDGVVVNYKSFGIASENFSTTNFGRTVVHEIGHWFNLIHTFGNGDGAYCSTDFVDDTPPEHVAAYKCSTFPKFDDCTFIGNGTMFMNYMDYGNDSCINLFTKGQKERMLAALSLYRSAILTSNGCGLVSGTSDLNAISFSVSPNPIQNGTFQCNFDSLINEGTVFVFDITGKRIFEQKFYASHQLTLSLPALNTGLYFVQLVTDRGRTTVKLMNYER